MTSTPRKRPLSPHLQVYRWQITMVMSILHRATGVALAAGTLVLVAWLLVLTGGLGLFEGVIGLATGLPMQVALLGFCACLVYHFLNGIRHLLWDVGYGYEIPKLYATGWTVIVLALVITGVIFFALMGKGGGA
ncbi:MAG: succinate dehydrogenase, cytochrome b556 subunit [Xanthomonadales bacterium]|nr:succinate dehydrogenase, cytochrome b556 subunit [Xanthomonadales bacterium]